jgi:hypothetical protein
MRVMRFFIDFFLRRVLHLLKCKVKVVFVPKHRAIKAYRGRGDKSSCAVRLRHYIPMSLYLHAPIALSPGYGSPVPVG